jgi:glycosyltransferase involved in cell wall biosynthesis
MKTLAISIILPVYNAENYIQECIDSILGQIFTNFELIIINDGSTDNSREMINSYKDQRIKVMENQHNFIKALNLGIKYAEGKYIARMDADDIMLPHRLETQFNFMESNPDTDICGSWAEAFGMKNMMIKSPVDHIDIISNLILNNALLHPTVIMRKSSVCKYPDYPDLYEQTYLYAEDYRLWTELAMKGYKFANIPEVLLKYRSSETQVTSVNFQKMMSISRNIQKQYIEQVAEIIIEKDTDYYPIFSNAIELISCNKISFNTLKLLTFDIFQKYLKQQE